mmetsp:Transcript_4811/g.5564  ORF Transcript_4811/g.5564 Transcript_4811/m.5564 type:complete len:232 (-) Transcript_4811:160-855(-)
MYRRSSSIILSAFMVVAYSLSATVAFQPQLTCGHHAGTSTLTSLHAARQSSDDALYVSTSTGPIMKLSSAIRTATAALTLSFLVMASPAGAVSGGGSDFASLDISAQDFSNQNYKGKDFTQVVAKGTTFAKSNLQGCRFYNSYLVNADFEGADARGASFERNNMDGVNLKNAVLGGAYFGDSLPGVLNLENADFTDASIPAKVLGVICSREDAKGTNPTTGEATRDTLMCP